MTSFGRIDLIDGLGSQDGQFCHPLERIAHAYVLNLTAPQDLHI